MTIAELRMRALRLEESDLWAEASDAWCEVVQQAKEAKGLLVTAMRAEFGARYAAALRRADEGMAFVLPLFRVEENVKNPEVAESAVKPLDAGPTQGSTGAK